MPSPLVLQGGRSRRRWSHGNRRRHAGRRPGRRGHVAGAIAAIILFAAAILLGLMASRASDPTWKAGPARAPTRPAPPRSTYATLLAPTGNRVSFHPGVPLRSGLLFDVGSGRILWGRDSGAILPIASLTKMMTALVVAAHTAPDTPVLITPDALHYAGSGVGLLPLGKRVPVEPLLYGLLLPSGNDAAIALADHVAGTQERFVAMMNARAAAMGLECSHFDNVSGIVDQGNYSCARDLATLAHAILIQPRLATIVAARSAVLPFPIKGGKLYLYNNNPLVLMRYPGVDGVKTGYTQAAGSCLVASARRGRTWLGVVLLHSANPAQQAQNLLGAGFAKAA